jgi:hypothetical protein
MSLSNATETALAQYIFEGTNPSWHGATQLDLHLHKADPGEAGTSATNEADYTNYALVTVARSGTDWTTSGNTVTNDSLIQFPQCTGGSNTLTHWSVTPNGSTTILVSGSITTPLNISTGITPQFAASDIGVVFD